MKTKKNIGAEEYTVRLVSDGRISIGKAAEILNTTIYDIYNIAKKHKIELGASEDQRIKSRETAEKLFNLK